MLLKILKEVSSPSKFKLFSLLWDCKHDSVSFSIIQRKFGLTDANLSKQSKELVEIGAVLKTVKGREKFLTINPEFRKKWSSELSPILNSEISSQYKCICSDIHDTKGASGE